MFGYAAGIATLWYMSCLCSACNCGGGLTLLLYLVNTYMTDGPAVTSPAKRAGLLVPCFLFNTTLLLWLLSPNARTEQAGSVLFERWALAASLNSRGRERWPSWLLRALHAGFVASATWCLLLWQWGALLLFTQSLVVAMLLLLRYATPRTVLEVHRSYLLAILFSAMLRLGDPVALGPLLAPWAVAVCSLSMAMLYGGPWICARLLPHYRNPPCVTLPHTQQRDTPQDGTDRGSQEAEMSSQRDMPLVETEAQNYPPSAARQLLAAISVLAGTCWCSCVILRLVLPPRHAQGVVHSWEVFRGKVGPSQEAEWDATVALMDPGLQGLSQRRLAGLCQTLLLPLVAAAAWLVIVSMIRDWLYGKEELDLQQQLAVQSALTPLPPSQSPLSQTKRETGKSLDSLFVPPEGVGSSLEVPGWLFVHPDGAVVFLVLQTLFLAGLAWVANVFICVFVPLACVCVALLLHPRALEAVHLLTCGGLELFVPWPRPGVCRSDVFSLEAFYQRSAWRVGAMAHINSATASPLSASFSAVASSSPHSSVGSSTAPSAPSTTFPSPSFASSSPVAALGPPFPGSQSTGWEQVPALFVSGLLFGLVIGMTYATRHRDIAALWSLHIVLPEHEEVGFYADTVSWLEKNVRPSEVVAANPSLAGGLLLATNLSLVTHVQYHGPGSQANRVRLRHLLAVYGQGSLAELNGHLQALQADWLVTANQACLADTLGQLQPKKQGRSDQLGSLQRFLDVSHGSNLATEAAKRFFVQRPVGPISVEAGRYKPPTKQEEDQQEELEQDEKKEAKREEQEEEEDEEDEEIEEQDEEQKVETKEEKDEDQMTDEGGMSSQPQKSEREQVLPDEMTEPSSSSQTQNITSKNKHKGEKPNSTATEFSNASNANFSAGSPRPIPGPALSAAFIRDGNLPDGLTIVIPRQKTADVVNTLHKTWVLQNDGLVPWPEQTRVVFMRGDRIFLPKKQLLPCGQVATVEGPSIGVPLFSGQSVTVSFPLLMPSVQALITRTALEHKSKGSTGEMENGWSGSQGGIKRVLSYFQLMDASDRTFGPTLWLELTLTKAETHLSDEREAVQLTDLLAEQEEERRAKEAKQGKAKKTKKKKKNKKRKKKKEGQNGTLEMGASYNFSESFSTAFVNNSEALTPVPNATSTGLANLADCAISGIDGETGIISAAANGLASEGKQSLGSQTDQFGVGELEQWTRVEELEGKQNGAVFRERSQGLREFSFSCSSLSADLSLPADWHALLAVPSDLPSQTLLQQPSPSPAPRPELKTRQASRVGSHEAVEGPLCLRLHAMQQQDLELVYFNQAYSVHRVRTMQRQMSSLPPWQRYELHALKADPNWATNVCAYATYLDSYIGGRAAKLRAVEVWRWLLAASDAGLVVLPADCYFNFALIVDMDYGKFCLAEQLYQKAIALSPNNYRFLASLGTFYMEALHDYPRAESFFKQSLQLQPSNTWVACSYAKWHWDYGNVTGASTWVVSAAVVQSDCTRQMLEVLARYNKKHGLAPLVIGKP
eukprot:gb/GEZN01000263.1/.p1 GENE.gb/GEZN01000263.1/~~gb/GEZN01000263.1/.p1  ORF type:complete len:1658 (-),score=307.97 gb/GEZN01000263.1/:306-4853(-)